MFEWHKKERLNEQVKFFGGTQKKFISCYAKQVKPRIKVKLKSIKESNVYNVTYEQSMADYMAREALEQSRQLANLQAQAGSQLAGSNYAAQQQSIGIQNANHFMQQGVEAARGDIMNMFGTRGY